MSKNITLSIIFILGLIFLVSCSGGDGNIISPLPERAPVTQDAGNMACLGFWQVTIDKDAGTIEAVDMRSSDLILNVLGFLEPPVLKGMTIDFTTLVFNDPIVEVDVILTHPIPDPVFMGFDVRGVVFGPKVANADGLTVIPSPEFFVGVPFGYQDGLLGVPDSTANYGGLAGYKYFCDGLAKDGDLVAFMSNTGNLANRGVFSQGPMKNTRHYILDWGDVSHPFMVFNYAIYANYDWPSGTPPIDIGDFNITTANSREAFCCKVTELANSLYYASGFGGGGSISLQVEIWDWQGDISNVTIESYIPGPIAKTPYTVYLGNGSTNKSYMYEFYAVPGTPTKVGDLDILITVTDPKTFGGSWFLNLLPPAHPFYNTPLYNCFIHTANVIECPPAVVTSITPKGGFVGANINDASITGTFMAGSALAVKLKKTGVADITCSDVKFVSASTITCDINLAGAVTGKWDVVVTNGCGTPGTGPALFEVAPSKNIAIRPGVTPYDIAVDHADGDVLILYKDGQVWRYTAGGFYQDGASLCTTSTSCERIDASPNSYFITGGSVSGGSGLYSRSYSPTGAGMGIHGIYEQCVEVIGLTTSGLYDYHATISGYTSSYPNRVWINRFAPTDYSGGSGNIPNEGYGIGAMQKACIRGCESAKNTMASDIYFVEGAPEFRVERYNYYLTYTSVYWGGVQTDGMSGFNDPKDITRDNNNNYYILDKLSSGGPLVKKYTSSGSQVGSFGNSTTISGDPYRAEGSDFNGNIFVLHANGISIFTPTEIP